MHHEIVPQKYCQYLKNVSEITFSNFGVWRKERGITQEASWATTWNFILSSNLDFIIFKKKKNDGFSWTFGSGTILSFQKFIDGYFHLLDSNKGTGRHISCFLMGTSGPQPAGSLKWMQYSANRGCEQVQAACTQAAVSKWLGAELTGQHRY